MHDEHLSALPITTSSVIAYDFYWNLCSTTDSALSLAIANLGRLDRMFSAAQITGHLQELDNVHSTVPQLPTCHLARLMLYFNYSLVLVIVPKFPQPMNGIHINNLASCTKQYCQLQPILLFRATKSREWIVLAGARWCCAVNTIDPPPVHHHAFTIKPPTPYS